MKNFLEMARTIQWNYSLRISVRAVFVKAAIKNVVMIPYFVPTRVVYQHWKRTCWRHWSMQVNFTLPLCDHDLLYLDGNTVESKVGVIKQRCFMTQVFLFRVPLISSESYALPNSEHLPVFPSVPIGCQFFQIERSRYTSTLQINCAIVFGNWFNIWNLNIP